MPASEDLRDLLAFLSILDIFYSLVQLWEAGDIGNSVDVLISRTLVTLKSCGPQVKANRAPNNA